MRLYYCPECGKEQITSEQLYQTEETITNMRDGYGRPIKHYKCECGNYLAGRMDVNGWEDNKEAIAYAKDTIKQYNRDGIFYESNSPCRDMYEGAKKCYEENQKRRIKILKNRFWKKPGRFDRRDMILLPAGKI